MVRVATPENESILLSIALHGTAAHVERAVGGYRRVERIEAAQAAESAYRHRHLDLIWDWDGSLLIRGCLPAEVGELLQQALERAIELAESRTKSATGDSAESCSCEGTAKGGSAIGDSAESSVCDDLPEDERPVAAKRADALVRLAQVFLATEAEAMGSATERYQVVVHVDQATLANEPSGSSQDSATSRTSELESGRSLAAETVRRLACDSALVGMIDDASGEPLSVGRRTRAVPPAIKRALKARDRGCRFPGCAHTRFTESHHVEHWADGGETKLSNLVTLCSAHHHLLHEGGFRIERTDDGVFRFLKPDGEPVVSRRDFDSRLRGVVPSPKGQGQDVVANEAVAPDAIEKINADRGIAIGPNTIVTRWLGEPMDLSLVMDAMLAARERQRARERGSSGESIPTP
jgi:hypothetical protein